MNNEWVKNTGVVPEGVTKDTVIEVFYRCGGEYVWGINEGLPNDNPDLWILTGSAFDIIRWRFVMKLELGKYYKTKNGTKVGPCKTGNSAVYPYDFPGSEWYYQEDGTCGNGDIDCQRPFDIVSEWTESPVRVITKRELVPGVYGNLSINAQMGIHVGWTYGAEEIKQLIQTLQEVVEVLEETNA